MKTSNKILLISLAVIGGFILVAGVASRIYWEGALVRTEEFRPEQSAGDFKDFTVVRASSVWEIDIRRGDAFAVSVSAPDGVDAKAYVRQDGNVLVLGDRRRRWGDQGRVRRASLTMPDISGLEFSGVANVTLSGFRSAELNVTSSGAGAVVCRDSDIENLKVILSGVGSVDFSAARTRNADVELSGLGSLKLNMTGGELTGRLSGLGSIEYAGKVSAERIDRSGLGSVQHK